MTRERYSRRPDLTRSTFTPCYRTADALRSSAGNVRLLHRMGWFAAGGLPAAADARLQRLLGQHDSRWRFWRGQEWPS